MIESVIKEIIEALKQKELNAYRYFGQLSTPSEPELMQSKLPMILVDFVGDEAKGYERILYFNLYFIHISYSQNKDYRVQTQSTLISMLESAEDALFNMDTALIQTRRGKKIYDAKIDKGYLTVFSREITATITREESIKWIEQ